MVRDMLVELQAKTAKVLAVVHTEQRFQHMQVAPAQRVVGEVMELLEEREPMDMGLALAG